MKPLLTVEQVMEILRGTTSSLETFAEGTSDEHFYAVTDYGWSVNQQLGHLRAAHDVLGGNMLRIVCEDHPAWKGAPGWRNQDAYFELEFASNLEAFGRQRVELLEAIEPLPASAWQRTATVTVPPKKVYRYSALYYGDWMARHERSHLKHMARILEQVA
jgi:hypothetical protein